jgi:cell wall-associated NlpC family hydrolase
VDTSVIVQRAIAWALEREGSADYALRCLAFVEDAYEQPNEIEVFGADSARESADLYKVEESTGEPPPGAFVFFSTVGAIDGITRDWGHVGLAMGDGRIVHTWPEVRVDQISDVPSLPSGSWSAPVYLGFAPPSRILEGAAPVRPDGSGRTG